jgi:hypothetical protein
MCLFSEAELNCVNTKMRLMFELIQLLIGISTNRYLPAIGTAGFERLAVNGYNLVPAPPPKITAIIEFAKENIGYFLYEI